MQYLTVGTSEIREDLFCKIEDTGTIKPKGGLWLTIYDPRYKNYNAWVDFILDDPITFFYKNRGTSIWEQPCSVVTLKEDARIFELDSQESLTLLNEKYAGSYDLLSKDYDGMFVHMLGLIGDVNDARLREQVLRFGVDSLVLFNLSCIDYYQSGIVAIEPFDYEYGAVEMTSYEIKYEDAKKKIRKK